MEKIIAARHIKIDQTTKDYINNQLVEIEGEYRKLTSARVIIAKQKAFYNVEVILHGKHLEIESHHKDTHLKPAIDIAVDKADRQLRKHLDKLHDHHHTSLSDLEAQLVAAEHAKDQGETDYLPVD